jgi:hypothetical protein
LILFFEKGKLFMSSFRSLSHGPTFALAVVLAATLLVRVSKEEMPLTVIPATSITLRNAATCISNFLTVSPDKIKILRPPSYKLSGLVAAEATAHLVRRDEDLILTAEATEAGYVGAAWHNAVVSLFADYRARNGDNVGVLLYSHDLGSRTVAGAQVKLFGVPADQSLRDDEMSYSKSSAITDTELQDGPVRQRGVELLRATAMCLLTGYSLQKYDHP